MALIEGQLQIRDLVMGPGTVYSVQGSTNFFARSVRADQSGKRAWNHGGWSGVEWQDEAVIPIRILVDAGTGTAQWVAAHQQLAAAFRPVGESPADVELRFAVGGSEYVMFGRPRMVEPEVELIGLGRSFTQCAFVALDPFIYAGDETVAGPIDLPTVTGGLTVPFTVPFSIDVIVTGGTASLVNGGTADAGLLLRIDGPVTGPVVSLSHASGTVQTLRIDAELADGEWLEIDTAARTVVFNDVTSLRGQASGDWPILPTGTHTIRWLSGDNTQTGTLTVRFRSAWW